MADYLLDTNILRYWYDTRCPQNGSVVTKVGQVREPDPRTGYTSRLFISVVTLAEVEYGHRVTCAPDTEAQSQYRAFIARELPPALEISRQIHEPYSQLRAWLFNHCADKRRRSKAKRPEELVNPANALELGIDENDLWIASQAALHNFVLVTADGLANLAEAIQNAGVGPRLEDWTKP